MRKHVRALGNQLLAFLAGSASYEIHDRGCECDLTPSLLSEVHVIIPASQAWLRVSLDNGTELIAIVTIMCWEM